VIATKKQLARWADLKNRKDRDESGLFLAEGTKVVAEARRAGWEIEALLGLEGTFGDEGYTLTAEQMERVSGFRTAPEALAVVRRPLSLAPPTWRPGTLALVLDGLQDPGNVGTLIRTAVWFGFTSVFHTKDTADPFGPKAVQASMGALFHTTTAVIDPEWFDTLPGETPIFGTFLEGEPVFGSPLPSAGLLVLGNEGHGIRPALASKMTRRLTIPRFGDGAESLNVASAAAVLMAEFRRGGNT
jgi:TrmH family RNA methyltransferase